MIRSSVPEGLGVAQDIVDSLAAAGFLIGDQGQADVIIGLDSQGLKGLDGEDRGDQVLLVVFDAAAVDFSAFDPGPERVAFPQGEFARRNDVHMGHDPDRFGRALAPVIGQDVRPVSEGASRSGALMTSMSCEPVLLEEI